MSATFEKASPPFARYVAIGDSSTEGVDDRDAAGRFIGWSRRLAAHIEASRRTRGLEPLEYANLGVRGRSTREILESQLEPARAMKPDLVTVFSGTNDVLARRFDPDRLRRDLLALQQPFRREGVAVISFTLPVLTPLMPAARLVEGRIRTLNALLHQVCAETGTLLIDFDAYAFAVDDRFWSEDRLHANGAGHARIAQALAETLGVEGVDGSWKEPPDARPEAGFGSRLAAEGRWIRRYLLPWLWDKATGRTPEPPGPGQPELAPFRVPEAG
ncbi:hypothetical protein ABI59_07015 [Acidobacteria bacterium Mor1]|nr:hypothetical protein ABI59_07015 [Acidobacteria bacterium Mor1]